MPSFRESKGIIYSQTSINLPLDLKTKAQALGINITQAAIAGIEAEVKKKEVAKEP